MVSARLQNVLATKHRNDGVGMPVTHLELLFEVGNLLHVGERRNLLQLLHPMINGLAVLLLNRREVRRGTSHLLLSHGRIVLIGKGVAEREGFEPSMELPPNRISNAAP